MIIHECEQGSDEWHALRIGRVTGTYMQKMVTGSDSVFDNLCYQIAAEHKTGVYCRDSGFKSDAMQHGNDMESEARDLYSADTLQHVREVGFVEKDILFGVSPDGLVGDAGIVEIKCPKPNTHLKYLIGDKTWRSSYKWQIYGELWVTGREWCDFVSYCPDYRDPELRMFRQLVERDESIMQKISDRAGMLAARVNEILDRLPITTNDLIEASR